MVKILLSFLQVPPVDNSMITAFLDVCNTLVVSDKNKEKITTICNKIIIPHKIQTIIVLYQYIGSAPYIYN